MVTLRCVCRPACSYRSRSTARRGRIPGPMGISPGLKNSPPELYKCSMSCYFLVFCGVFPCFFYDMVTAARCPRTGIVPRNRAEVKRAFCSVSWKLAELHCAQQSAWNSAVAIKGQRKIAAPLYLRMLFRCIMRGHLRNATLQLWCNP